MGNRTRRGRTDYRDYPSPGAQVALVSFDGMVNKQEHRECPECHKDFLWPQQRPDRDRHLQKCYLPKKHARERFERINEQHDTLMRELVQGDFTRVQAATLRNVLMDLGLLERL